MWYVWPQLKTTFSDLNQQNKILEKIRRCTPKTGIPNLPEKMPSKIIINIIKTGTLLSKSCVIFFIF